MPFGMSSLCQFSNGCGKPIHQELSESIQRHLRAVAQRGRWLRTPLGEAEQPPVMRRQRANGEELPPTGRGGFGAAFVFGEELSPRLPLRGPADELFAPKFLPDLTLTEEAQAEMADALGADSLRFLPVESIARAVSFDQDQLCQACITGEYPTQHGEKMYQIALEESGSSDGQRTYERR